MKLYLMRHGEASATKDDTEQVLTPHGKAAIEQLAERLQHEKLQLSQVYHSGKKRAQQTAEIMIRFIAPGLTANVLDNIKPSDDPAFVLPVINSWSENCLITSHLPFIPNLVTLLTRSDSHLGSINYVPGTLICLEKNNDNHWEIIWATAP